MAVRTPKLNCSLSLRLALSAHYQQLVEHWDPAESDPDSAAEELAEYLVDGLVGDLRECGMQPQLERLTQRFGGVEQLAARLEREAVLAFGADGKLRHQVTGEWIVRRLERACGLRWIDDRIALPKILELPLRKAIAAAVCGATSSPEAAAGCFDGVVAFLSRHAASIRSRRAQALPELTEYFRHHSPFAQYEQAREYVDAGHKPGASMLAILKEPPTPHDGTRTDGALKVLCTATHVEFADQPPAPEMIEELSAQARPYAQGQAYAVGDALEHSKFGRGVVARVACGKITVEFGSGTRVLAHAG
jgi:hypothetical protein